MGEEWRRALASKVDPKGDTRVLVVGAGPAGHGNRACFGTARLYETMLAEATRGVELAACGTEATLPGLGEYIRVKDYREQQMLKMPDIEVFRESQTAPQDVHAVETDHVVIATSAHWRKERFDGNHMCRSRRTALMRMS
jgi:dimethylamine/trimethylamine dehydrogenase